MTSIFFSSGLFLGWSLGANNMSNVFGTAVGTRMIRFRTAAVWCSVFVILGSVVSGSGATQTLGKLGSINALAGAFMVALSSAVTMFVMTKASYPASTSQTIVGSIVGWNLFSGSLIDYGALTKILSTWVFCPILAALFSMLLYLLCRRFLGWFKPHMLTQDHLTRMGLLLAGIFGSYALGANNISTVMGVFVPISDFSEINLFGLFTLTAAQQLFFLGGLAIAVGVFTYSKKVIMTVGGGGIMKLSPVAAFIVVVSHSLVLTIFSSQGLSDAFVSAGLPAIPLVPVSSSQAIVGAVIGIGLLKGGRAIRWRTVGAICSSWAVTPVLAAVICFVSLFFLQNVFMQQTYRPERYRLTEAAVQTLSRDVDVSWLAPLAGRTFPNAREFKDRLDQAHGYAEAEVRLILDAARMEEAPPSDEGADATGRTDHASGPGSGREAIQ
ncbi:inorganic phosphate transporter [Pseudodesulfovibrio indicus]|jgi:PiT family inorganic phosphate transporter|uniref:Phosphate transporter n=1 Tax=Pseudodesulfovibrio indicus TaxID=1716143 RepID=A0AA94TPT0_9BACT|nr:inorganic phosphate transporter [Pseudodesulfovibrio indicus]TDT86342.1 PiT family inorganic phosphate transporter [Pseudodesulfovibrio indicus]